MEGIMGRGRREIAVGVRALVFSATVGGRGQENDETSDGKSAAG